MRYKLVDSRNPGAPFFDASGEPVGDEHAYYYDNEDDAETVAESMKRKIVVLAEPEDKHDDAWVTRLINRTGIGREN